MDQTVFAPRIAMHIVVVMHDFSTGGSERIAIRMANRWARRGRHVTILSGVAEGPARALVAPGVDVRITAPEIHRAAFSRLRLGRAFADLIAGMEADLVFSPGNFHFPVVGALTRRMAGNRPAIVYKISIRCINRDGGARGSESSTASPGG